MLVCYWGFGRRGWDAGALVGVWFLDGWVLAGYFFGPWRVCWMGDDDVELVWCEGCGKS